ncbi:MAG: TerB family tellurite resistance protein [Pseudomonadota bacterium]|jgi:uncharacterized tellurite resistance protein B-like protein|nr:TerB family tellurite resistance protein [Pseudomonadota bacterium]
MLKELREILNKTLEKSNESNEDRDHGLRLATATLLVEIVRADYEEDLVEGEAVFAQLREFFSLSEEETGLLVQEAEREADHAVSLQEFTRELHEQLSIGEKHSVIEMLWRVALADSKLDKHEDYLIRKVAGLLYVPHNDLIRIRNRVRGDSG